MLTLNPIRQSNPVSKTSLSESLVGYLKQQILDGILNPGDRIVETKIAEDLEISQTPVREALRQLAGEGIVTLVPNRGPIVRDLQMSDVFEIYSVRAGLEGLAMRFATQSASDEEIGRLVAFHRRMEEKAMDDTVTVAALLADSASIHQYVVDLSRHTRLVAMYRSISFQIALVNRILGRESTKKKEVDQHREVVEALASRDPDFAEKTMRQHIHRSYGEFLDVQKDTSSEYRQYLWF